MKWEYNIIKIKYPLKSSILADEKKLRYAYFDEWMKELDELGEYGWELVNVIDDVEQWVFFFKRKRLKNDFSSPIIIKNISKIQNKNERKII